MQFKRRHEWIKRFSPKSKKKNSRNFLVMKKMGKRMMWMVAKSDALEHVWVQIFLITTSTVKNIRFHSKPRFLILIQYLEIGAFWRVCTYWKESVSLFSLWHFENQNISSMHFQLNFIYSIASSWKHSAAVPCLWWWCWSHGCRFYNVE